MAIFEQTLLKSILDPFIPYVKNQMKFFLNAYLLTLIFRSILPETQDFFFNLALLSTHSIQQLVIKVIYFRLITPFPYISGSLPLFLIFQALNPFSLYFRLVYPFSSRMSLHQKCRRKQRHGKFQNGDPCMSWMGT